LKLLKIASTLDEVLPNKNLKLIHNYNCIAMAKKNIQENELKRLMEIAYQLNKQEKGEGYHIEDVKATAKELGISEDKVNQAYEILEKEKQAKIAHSQALRQRSQNVAIGALVIIFAIFAYFYFNRPTPAFDGKVNITLTSELDKNLPKDKLETVELFHTNQVLCFLNIFDMKNAYKLRWELYESDGKLHERLVLNTPTPQNDIYPAYATFRLNINDKLGTWRFKIFADKKLIGEKSFQVTLGKPDISITHELAKDFPRYPLSVRTEFRKGIDPKVMCHIYWTNLTRKGTTEFNWIDPQGNLFRKVSVNNDPDENGGGYYNFSTLNLIDLKVVGEWRVEVFFDGIKFGEKKFKIL
jgi:hypothetical protein